MKLSMFVVSIFTIIFSFCTVNMFAQKGGINNRNTGWGAGSQYNKMYNVNTVETISGEVVSVDKISPVKGMSFGIHLLVRTTDKDTISVHLGPGWFMDKQKIIINPKDEITVTGSRIIYQNNPAIIASEIKKGEDTIILRDKNGYPVWSRSKRK
jgi:hypothetical protein